ncbi:MAG TPA: M14 family metallopeptidase, partial [Candidatus Eisenbacteria bacterium]|nr:M14 family metallopeptidase [Candidatus Eisenbacteria bacterium]
MIRPLRAAAVGAAALLLLGPAAHAQTRPARAAAFSPDSVVQKVIRGGSAALFPNPPVDMGIPRIWQTRAERTRWRETADYDETIRYCRQLEAGSRWIRYETYGRSEQGRDLPLLVVSKDRVFTPEAARAGGKPVILIQNGIHAGEIEGKDATLMLLRDLAVLHQHSELLDSCTLVVLPIFSVDAHERAGRYNRINQNGPETMGWRQTPAGYNLNRDYMKADTPEMRALLANVYTRWWPELLVDDHTTDGADYRHDVTWQVPHGPVVPPSITRWETGAIEGRVMPRLAAMGHLPAPYLSFRRGNDPLSGIDYDDLPPRFSTGYTPLQCRAALLVETHMLKPYGVRVKATYDLLLALLEEIHARPRALVDAVHDAEAAVVARGRATNPAARALALDFKTTDRAESFPFKGVVTVWDSSEVTGSRVPRYTSAPWDTLIPLYRDMAPTLTVIQPAGYLVPQEWSVAVDRLALHGVRVRRFARAWSDTVEMTRVTDWSVSPQGYEGHHLVSVRAVRPERQLRAFRPGDVWVPLDQPSAAVAVNLLEAQAPDGLMAWGYFESVFQKKEFGEPYVVEPLARAMLAHDPRLAAEFQARLVSDSTFAASPEARTDFFYRRSPWADPDQDLDPIARALRAPPESVLAPDSTAAPAPAR